MLRVRRVNRGQPDHRDLRGSRDEKHRVLKAETQDTLARQQLSVIGPRFFFVPKDFSLGNEFMAWPGLREIFPVMATGVGTGKDGAFVSFDRAPLVRLAEDIADEEIGPEELHERYGLKDTGGWNFSRRRSAFELRGALEPRICEYYYRPFDVRYVLYDPIIRRDQRQHMRHMQADNVALLVSAQQSTLAFHHVMCSDRIVDESALSNRTKERCYVVPLYLYSGGGSHAELDLGERELRCNISSSLMQRVSRGLGCEWIGARGGSTSREIGAADVFAYTYALMHSPTYRERYAEFLRIDMPRVPMTRSLDAFRALAEVGSRLVNLHLMRDPRPDVAATSFIGSRGLPVESVSYTEGTVWIDRRRTRGFTGVTEETWGFRVGCYQVCEKWLKDRQARGGKRPRPGRVLTDDEIERYRNLVAVLGETIRAMRSVDDIVEVHGGWPGAFEGIKE